MSWGWCVWLREGRIHVWLVCDTTWKFTSDRLSETDQRDFSMIWLLVIQSPLAYCMAPCQRIHCLPSRLYCPVQGCHKGLQSKSGFIWHVQALHGDLQPASLQPLPGPCVCSSVKLDDHPSSSLPTPDDLDILDVLCLNDFHGVGDSENFDFTFDNAEMSGPPSCQTSLSSYDEELLQREFTKYHPLINGRLWTFVCTEFWRAFLGKPCDSDGGLLDPELPLLVPKAKDWTPYGSHVAFELADFIYRCNQMSAGNFNMLCELWKATLLPHDNTPPFSNYGELCQTIDKTPVRGVAWENISLSYTGLQLDDAPL